MSPDVKQRETKYVRHNMWCVKTSLINEVHYTVIFNKITVGLVTCLNKFTVELVTLLIFDKITLKNFMISDMPLIYMTRSVILHMNIEDKKFSEVTLRL